MAEIALGAVLLAFPVAVTEEVWDLGRELPPGRTLFIAVGSLVFISWFAYYLFYRATLRDKWGEYVFRVGTAYFVTLAMVSLVLLTIGQWPIVTEPAVALKRTVIVSLPASFSATVVDSIRG